MAADNALAKNQSGLQQGYSNLLQNSFIGDLVGTLGDVASGVFTLKEGWSNYQYEQDLKDANVNAAKLANNITANNALNSQLQSQQLTKILTTGMFGIVAIGGIYILSKVLVK